MGRDCSARNSGLFVGGRRFKVLRTDSVSQNVPWIGPAPAQLHRFILPVRYPLPFHLHHNKVHPGMSQGNRDNRARVTSSHYVMPPVCLTWRGLWPVAVCWDGWVGVGGRGRSGCLGQEIWTRSLGSISLTLTCDIDRPWTCDGPFCHGQITWENGPSPSRKVRHC